MGNVAVRAEGVSKRYVIGAARNRPDTLRDQIAHSVRALFQPNPRAKAPTIWALRDVGFEVKHGEVLGIIGRNGAGKSTLLKILSRITEPTRGRVQVRGRVGSLLEVGTGFHPELTGRENIYLNGAILGLPKQQIDRTFDEIVAFSGVEPFIDTPVKRYSSGMYVRLAFAVAAHLEQEILVVDEVLAVGDSRFQRRCLNKMQAVGQEGRTVLFISHDMPAITRLCPRAILLEGGQIVADGPSAETVGRYLKSGSALSTVREWPDPTAAPGDELARLRAVRVRDAEGRVSEALDIRRPILVEMEYDVLQGGYVLSSWYDFFTDAGVQAFGAVDHDPTWRRRPRPAGRYVSTAYIPGNLLSEGTVFVSAGLARMNPTVQLFYERDLLAFHVVDALDGDSARGDWAGPWGGVVRPLLQWKTEPRGTAVSDGDGVSKDDGGGALPSSATVSPSSQ